MTQADIFVNKALSYIGYNCTHFISVMADYGASYGQAWCAWFVSAVARECKLTDVIPLSGGAGSIPRAGVPKSMGRWYEGHNSKPQKGDIIVFTWNGLGSYENVGQDKYYSDHIGIVYAVDSNYVYTVEGNANGSNTGSTVCKKSYALYSGKINGYYRPNWSDSNIESEENYMEIKKGDNNNFVLAYKAMLIQARTLGIINQKVDNTIGFGDGTYKATIEVQKKFNLDVDGIAGVQTITALRNAINAAMEKFIKPVTERNAVLNEAIAAIDKLKV